MNWWVPLRVCNTSGRFCDRDRIEDHYSDTKEDHLDSLKFEVIHTFSMGNYDVVIVEYSQTLEYSA
jgi:hypothetical protein